MTTIVTRAGKGSPLTNNEVDTNFTNLNDAKIETLTSTDSSVTITGTGSSRDLSVPINPSAVSGPASSTDNAITRFDGTTGKLLQNSTVTLDDNGNVINANSLGFDTTPATVPTTVGTMSWDDGDGVPIVALKGGNVNLQVGTQELARVYNDSGTTLTKGQVVYISGAQGNRVAVKLARADVEATSFGTIGLVAETMTSGSEGFIIVSGALYKLDTSGLVAGATVYLSPNTAGAVTTTKPQAPQQLVVVGWVERVDNIVGSIYVKIDNGYELDELHDVQITSPQSGNILIYDATTSPIGVWKNANLTDGTGISITEGAGSITIANTGVTSLSGTANQVTASASTGAVTLSLPATINVNTSGSAATLTNGRTIAITGDLAYTSPSFDGSTNVTAIGTLATVNSNVGSFGSATDIPVVTVNAKGLVTAVSTASVQGGASLSNDTATATNLYPLFAAATTGTPTTIYTSNAKYLYKPSTGDLQATAMVSSNGLTINSNTVSTSYSIPSGSSAMSAGPMTVASGVSVTVPSGSRWVIL